MCCNYQVLFQLVSYPYALQLQSVAILNGFAQFKSCFLCLAGIQQPGGIDECAGSLLNFLAYQINNSLYNLIAIYIIRMTSAAWLNVATTLSIPLSDVMFAMPFIMGQGKGKVLAQNDIICLLFVVAGVAGYNYYETYDEGGSVKRKGSVGGLGVSVGGAGGREAAETTPLLKNVLVK